MDQHRTSVVWSPATRAHDPLHEVWVGVATPGTDVAARVDAILSALIGAGHRLVAARPQPDSVLARVHDASLLDFLAGAEKRWRLGPYAEIVGQSRVVPYLFPTPAMTAGLPTRPAVAVHADAGSYAYDTMTLIGPGTWEEEPYNRAGLYAEHAIVRFINLLGRTMWDRPPAPDVQQSTFLVARWPAIAAGDATIRAARDAVRAQPDNWIFLGLLVTEDGSRCVGVAAAADTPAHDAEVALRGVLRALQQERAPAEIHRWQRGGRRH